MARAHAYPPTTTPKIMWGCNVLEDALAPRTTRDLSSWSASCIRSWGPKRVEHALVCYRHIFDAHAYWPRRLITTELGSLTNKLQPLRSRVLVSWGRGGLFEGKQNPQMEGFEEQDLLKLGSEISGL